MIPRCSCDSCRLFVILLAVGKSSIPIALIPDIPNPAPPPAILMSDVQNVSSHCANCCHLHCNCAWISCRMPCTFHAPDIWPLVLEMNTLYCARSISSYYILIFSPFSSWNGCKNMQIQKSSEPTYELVSKLTLVMKMTVFLLPHHWFWRWRQLLYSTALVLGMGVTAAYFNAGLPLAPALFSHFERKISALQRVSASPGILLRIDSHAAEFWPLVLEMSTLYCACAFFCYYILIFSPFASWNGRKNIQI